MNPSIAFHGFGNQSGNAVHHIDPGYGQCMVADSSGETAAVVSSCNSNQPGRKEPKTYEGYFDGTVVRVVTDEVFSAGKRFRLVEISDGGEDEAERKRRAWETIQEIIRDRKPYHKASHEDPFYKEELYAALEEKYGPIG